MDIKVTPKIIKNMCGTVSFKRGDSFYKANKVIFHEYREDFCEATVKSTEDFHVVIQTEATKEFQATCSCPTLPNFSKSCQHIAAVLIAIYERERQRTFLPDTHDVHGSNRALSEEFLTLFQDKTKRTSGHQLHFEKRQVLDVRFKLKPYLIEGSQYLFGIEMEIGQIRISAIREFLQDVQQGKCSSLSPEFQYNPQLHCFMKESDKVLHQLIEVARDERVFLKAQPSHINHSIKPEILLIPPSAWKELKPLLLTVPFFTLEQNGHFYDYLQLIDGPPPLQFTIEESNGDVQLTMKGFRYGAFGQDGLS